MHIILVRHGEAAHDAATPDWDLSRRGVQQARLTGGRLVGARLTHIVSSPLLRALATAHIIAEAIDQQTVDVWPDLREGSDDAYRGVSRGVIEARFPRALLPARMPTDGWLCVGDTYASFAARCRRVLDEFSARFAADDRVLVVTHGGFANHLLHALLHMPPWTPVWFDVAHCSLTTVRLVPEHEREGWPLYPPNEVDILGMNDVAHLSKPS
jgi:broad specificity phosphatase PhoE